MQRLGVALQQREHEQRFGAAHRHERVAVAAQVGVALGLPERVAQRAGLRGDPRLALSSAVRRRAVAAGVGYGCSSSSPASLRNREGRRSAGRRASPRASRTAGPWRACRRRRTAAVPLAVALGASSARQEGSSRSSQPARTTSAASVPFARWMVESGDPPVLLAGGQLAGVQPAGVLEEPARGWGGRGAPRRPARRGTATAGLRAPVRRRVARRRRRPGRRAPGARPGGELARLACSHRRLAGSGVSARWGRPAPAFTGSDDRRSARG